MDKIESKFPSRVPEFLKVTNEEMSRTQIQEKYKNPNGKPVSPSSLYRWSCGEWPPLRVLLSLAEEHNTNISYLLGITDINHPLDSYTPTLNLKKTLEGEGVSEQFLANKMGTARRIISEYVSRPKYTRVATLVKIALALNISVDYILGLTSIKQWDILIADQNPFFLCTAGEPAYICPGEIVHRISEHVEDANVLDDIESLLEPVDDDDIDSVDNTAGNEDSDDADNTIDIADDEASDEQIEESSGLLERILAEGGSYCILHADGEHVIFPTGEIVDTKDSLFDGALAIPTFIYTNKEEKKANEERLESIECLIKNIRETAAIQSKSQTE